MKCPKCKKPYERKSSTGTYAVYEHASRNENGFLVVSSRDCCYVRLTRRAADLRQPRRSKTKKVSGASR